MTKREIKKNVFWAGTVDWDRRLFDSLIPLPDGTSYNAYLIRGSTATALLDTTDPSKLWQIEEHLADVPRVDYLVAHHGEQDHSGAIPWVLAKYPEAKVVCTPLAKGILIDHLGIDPGRVVTVADGERISLGDRTLRFIHSPWVHWPETMSTYLEEEKILFSCDWFGSHLATSDLFVKDESRVYESAKRYFAEIMLPFRATIRKNLEKIKDLPIDIIAPSHGPLYPRPEFIIEAYKEWASETPKNYVVLPYVSMHGSTALMVEHLAAAIARRGVTVQVFSLPVTDVGKLAMSLVDAATIVVGCPAVHVGPHPVAANAVILANALRPKVRFVSVVGSYGWANKIVETISGLIPNIKAEILPPVLTKGLPKEADFKALDVLADAIAEKHKAAGLI
jgi:flavorubredoxin